MCFGKTRNRWPPSPTLLLTHPQYNAIIQLLVLLDVVLTTAWYVRTRYMRAEVRKTLDVGAGGCTRGDTDAGAGGRATGGGVWHRVDNYPYAQQRHLMIVLCRP